MLTERQKLILERVVEEYIRHAQPVSSHVIAEEYDFDAGPATVRNELMALEENGYLAQPHTSSGRVPTDKGYRFYVNSIVARQTREREQIYTILADIVRIKTEEQAMFAELARAVAIFSQNAVLSGPARSRALFRAGINEALRQPELADSDTRQHFGRVIDSFEDNMNELYDELEEGSPAVFIGRENPILGARGFGMVAARYRLPAHEGVVVILGPKRMDYERSFSVLQALTRLLD
ncbi:MAG: hypothetical protein AAB581_03415 [Patescibacteria group bacterium]